ncbi:hypothetical protein ACIQU6_07535 [Streptomyces sp. NPDC090442]|uniref:hypothetical protein n=1 Tax=Streptomyces sp. NPDC090442 TaxID=3365962 RepID=UPI003829F83C
MAIPGSVYVDTKLGVEYLADSAGDWVEVGGIAQYRQGFHPTGNIDINGRRKWAETSRISFSAKPWAREVELFGSWWGRIVDINPNETPRAFNGLLQGRPANGAWVGISASSRYKAITGRPLPGELDDGQLPDSGKIAPPAINEIYGSADINTRWAIPANTVYEFRMMGSLDGWSKSCRVIRSSEHTYIKGVAFYAR